MTYPHHAKIVVFGNGKPDEQYLSLWRDAPLSYVPGQPTDASWHSDDYAEVLVHDPHGTYFQRAADWLMRYQFYPPSLMHHVSDFSQEKRWLRAGDRLVQRIHGRNVLGFPIFDLLTMNEIYTVIDEPRRKGFTYATTQVHIECGEWSPSIEWLENNDLLLTIHVHSRLARTMPGLVIAYSRRIQTRAHHQGIAHFRRLVLDSAKTPV